MPYYLEVSIGDFAILFTFLFYFLLDILPTLVLHIQYYLKNRCSKLELDTGSNVIAYSSLIKNYEYPSAKIKSFDYYRAYGKGSGWNSFGRYRYYKIVFEDNTQIFITCLMVNDIENTLEDLLSLKAQKHFQFLNVLLYS